ncbi:hypothetical protein CPB83DRAFT_897439 [Crepidotus variabilis]|uniref:Uncharacterized protein n=1 Tax=Crepidotus variabilis TaxID=179855 RepID=A0A9P6JL63_9AGAR|nr:hypothetical protein CPB83DRAFT_897439 [Crepidotus variabilis]
MNWLNYIPFYTVLGGNRPRITTELPFITSGRNSPAFPIAVQVKSRAEANNVLQLQTIINEYTQTERTFYELARLIYHDPLTAQILTASPYQQFWAIYFGNRIGIFVDWDVATRFYSGTAVQGCRKFLTFCGAFCFMVSKGFFKVDQITGNNTLPPPLPIASTASIVVHESDSEPDDDFDNVDWDFDISQTITPDPNDWTEMRRSIPAPVITDEMTEQNPFPSPPYSHHVPPPASSVQSYTPSSIGSVSATSTRSSSSSKSFPTSLSSKSLSSYSSTTVTKGRGGPRRVKVYRFLRDFRGITHRILHRRDLPSRKDDEDMNILLSDAFGPVVRSYLISHGYNADSCSIIAALYEDCTDIRAFVQEMCAVGVSAAEAEWIWMWSSH